jgi:hypothetical protein
VLSRACGDKDNTLRTRPKGANQERKEPQTTGELLKEKGKEKLDLTKEEQKRRQCRREEEEEQQQLTKNS